MSASSLIEASEPILRKVFEEKYKNWRREVENYGDFLPDDSGITLKSFKEDIVGLGVKVIPILIERMHQDICLAYAITLISQWRFIPGEREGKQIFGFKALADFYSNWWKEGQGGIKRLFEERYQRLKRVWNSSTQEEFEGAIRDLEYLGIAALPYFFEKIKDNETVFIPIVSRLSKTALKSDATVEECLLWWEKNKDDWIIPFPKNPQN
jgi:hypothetical protein